MTIQNMRGPVGNRQGSVGAVVLEENSAEANDRKEDGAMNAVRHQVETLARDPKEFFERRLRDALGDESEEISDELLAFVLLTPRMVEQIRRWNDFEGIRSEVNRLHGFLLGYLFHDRDLVPEDRLGLFGYLDDAYFAGRVYQLTWHEALACSPEHARHEDPDLARQLPDWLEHVRRVLPRATSRIDTAIDDLISGRDDSFTGLISSEH